MTTLQMVKALESEGYVCKRITPITPAKIRYVNGAVRHIFGINSERLMSKERTADTSTARFVAFKILHRLGYSTHAIGSAYKRSFATVHHGIQQIDQRCIRNPDFQSKVDAAHRFYATL